MEKLEKDKLDFLLHICMIIGIVYGICFYKNNTGIACVVFGIFLVLIIGWIKNIKRDKEMDFMHWFYSVSLVLLSLIPSVFDNLFLNVVGRILFIVILIKWVITIYYRGKEFDLLRNLYMILCFIPHSFIKMFSLYPDIRKEKGYKNMENLSTIENEPQKENKSSYKKQILKGVLMSVPFLVVIISLLTSADIVFKNMVENLFSGASNFEIIIKWCFTVFIGFMLAYGSGRLLLSGEIDKDELKLRQSDNVVGITFAGIIAGVYILFCITQIVTILSAGGDMLPEGYTYAKYARTGFFQLLFVCMINVALVVMCRLKFDTGSVLKKILVVISGCTYLMVVSSTFRILLYIKAYNLTFLRILVIWALLVIGVLMVFVIWFIFNPKIRLFEYALVTTVILFLGFSAINPDKMIASYNIKNSSMNNKDAGYLVRNLSMDMAEVIISDEVVNEFANEEIVLDYCKEIVEEYEKKDKKDIRKFNYSRYQAYKLSKNYLETVKQ